ncbi:MAG: hypothetical protein EA351_10110 [Gemmatimonadales bacterium]|nr:MAG: hypothetical protein EA351_10110 [Gemmatimonadales bacterium]
MNRPLRPLSIAAILLIFLLLPACATFVEYGSDTDFGIGARGNLPLGQLLTGEDQRGASAISRLEFAGSIHQFFPSGADYTEVNADLLLPLFRLGDGAARSYVGSGIHLGRISPDVGGSDSKLGLNLIGGVRFNRPTMAPFFEVRASVGGVDQLSAVAGLQLFGGMF